ncbi:chemotaxis protein CheZ [uncultured Gammaproteobacteria bacterium]
MTEVIRFTEEDYQELRRFVARTPRGRAFLREHESRARVLAAEEVKAMIGELRTAVSKITATTTAGPAQHIEVLRRELQDMSASIVHARREIIAMRPKDGGDDRFHSATNELDAIVQSTERASFEILNAAERIMALCSRLREAGAPDLILADLDTEVMNIFTACSFQDLTGQRTTKVINVLRYIEQRVLAMINIWGVDGVNPGEVPAEPVDTRPDAHLLNGPSDNGIDQGDIDAMFG